MVHDRQIIALVDQDKCTLSTVSNLLESEDYKVLTYQDGPSAIGELKGRRPNLAILDLRMPQMDGIEMLRQLRQVSDLPIIFLSSQQDDIEEVLGLKMGADDFIRKPFSQQVLIERVRAVMRRSSANVYAKVGELSSDAFVRGRLHMDPASHVCAWDETQIKLTVSEFSLLYCLAQRPGIVKSRNALMDVINDEQVFVDDRTIDSHIRRVRTKFKTVDDGFDMIETLYGLGYRYRANSSL
ncbi:response regulator transcription factor [uncultured Roseibium sp.]|uniref:response regulator transcription factor n=1 Tax=uncultured Roseibium sp. TaxID=1936171 RepID=UPI0026238F61|nr:response regulator transcription factor [uncultured Roseibium sp.]